MSRIVSIVFMVTGLVMVIWPNPIVSARGWVWLPIAIATYLVVRAIERERD